MRFRLTSFEVLRFTRRQSRRVPCLRIVGWHGKRANSQEFNGLNAMSWKTKEQMCGGNHERQEGCRVEEKHYIAYLRTLRTSISRLKKRGMISTPSDVAHLWRNYCNVCWSSTALSSTTSTTGVESSILPSHHNLKTCYIRNGWLLPGRSDRCHIAIRFSISFRESSKPSQSLIT